MGRTFRDWISLRFAMSSASCSMVWPFLIRRTFFWLRMSLLRGMSRAPFRTIFNCAMVAISATGGREPLSHRSTRREGPGPPPPLVGARGTGLPGHDKPRLPWRGKTGCRIAGRAVDDGVPRDFHGVLTLRRKGALAATAREKQSRSGSVRVAHVPPKPKGDG